MKNTIEQDNLRKEVVLKFKKERGNLGTDKFIEDAYNKYPDDETISAINNYLKSKFCYKVYLIRKDSRDDAATPDSWLDKARIFALKIPNTYNKEFSDEINDYLEDFFSKQSKEEIKNLVLKMKVYESLSQSDKKKIKEFIESKYEHYDKKDSKYTSDKYTKLIWKETAQKYGISQAHVDYIWSELN